MSAAAASSATADRPRARQHAPGMAGPPGGRCAARAIEAPLPAPQLPHLGRRRRSSRSSSRSPSSCRAATDGGRRRPAVLLHASSATACTCRSAALAVLLPFLLPMAAAMVARLHDRRRGRARHAAHHPAAAGDARLDAAHQVDRRHALPARRASASWSASGLLFGAIFFGLHPMVLLSGTTVGVRARPRPHRARLPLRPGRHGLHRLAGAALLDAHRLEPHGADRGPSSSTSCIAVLISFSYFDWLRPWVFPTYFENFVDFLRDPIYWRPILKGFAAFARLERGAHGARRGCSSGARTSCRSAGCVDVGAARVDSSMSTLARW